MLCSLNFDFKRRDSCQSEPQAGHSHTSTRVSLSLTYRPSMRRARTFLLQPMQLWLNLSFSFPIISHQGIVPLNRPTTAVVNLSIACWMVAGGADVHCVGLAV